MYSRVNFNGQILRIEDANLPAVSSAAFYGRGTFTTVAIYGGKPFLWNLHEKRLRENSGKIGIETGEINFEKLGNAVLVLIVANKIVNGRARITLFDSCASTIWEFKSERKVDILITTAERRELPENGLNLTISPFHVNTGSPLIGIKSCNYLENLLAFEDAKTQGFSEAVRLNERAEIVSAIMANIFWIKNKRVFTPSLTTGAVAGTTRAFVIDLARRNGLEVFETAAFLQDLQAADEIFLTSAGLQIRAVRSFEGKVLKTDLTRNLQQIFIESANA